MDEYQKSRNLCRKLAKIIIILQIIRIVYIVTMHLLTHLIHGSIWKIRWVAVSNVLLRFVASTAPQLVTYLLIAFFMIAFAGYLQKKRAVINDNTALDELQKSSKQTKIALLICGILIALTIAIELRLALLKSYSGLDKFTLYVIFPVNSILHILLPVLMACICLVLAQQLYWRRQVCVIPLPPSRDKKFITAGIAIAVICNFILSEVIPVLYERMWTALRKVSDSAARDDLEAQLYPTIRAYIFCNQLVYLLIMALFAWLTVRLISEQTSRDTQYISAQKNPIKRWALAAWGSWGACCLLDTVLAILIKTLGWHHESLSQVLIFALQLVSRAAPILLLWYVASEIRKKSWLCSQYRLINSKDVE